MILRIVDVLTVIAEQSERESELNKADVFGILEILRLFADEYHQGKEEATLFPAFTAVCDRAEVEAIRYMINEHDEDRFISRAMENAVRQSSPSDFATQARRLSEILRAHIYKEDHILFELVNKSLSTADDERILAEFEAFDKKFRSPQHDRLLHRLEMLEWKYRPAAA